MRFGRSAERDEILAQLQADAERAWGAERREALAPALENAATALWHLARAPLDLLEHEPDFVDGAAPREDEA